MNLAKVLFLILILNAGFVCAAFSGDSYSKTVVGQYSPKDIDSSDMEQTYFNYCVGPRGELYYKDIKLGKVKVFDFSGKQIRAFSLKDPRDEAVLMASGTKISAGDDKVLIYGCCGAVLCDLDGAGETYLEFGANVGDYIRFMHGTVFDVEDGRIFYSNASSAGIPESKKPFKARYKCEFKNGVGYIVESIKGDERTLDDYGGYTFWDLKTVDEKGNIFLNYARVVYPDPHNEDPKTRVYKFKLLKFDSHLNFLYSWDGDGYQVDDEKSNVYRLEPSREGVLQLIMWKEK